MKSSYETRYSYSLPRRTYTIVRCDGRAFHTYTRGLSKPFDMGLIEDMDCAAMALCADMSNAKMAYVQSDEISVLMTDFETTETQPWFDGDVQKVASVSASVATMAFNSSAWSRELKRLVSAMALDDEVPKSQTRVGSAAFDARVFIIPDPTEVCNYFLWRYLDCSRNAVSMVARSLFSARQLHGCSRQTQIEMIAAEGVCFDSLDAGFRNGRLIYKDGARWSRGPCFDLRSDMQRLRDMVPQYD